LSAAKRVTEHTEWYHNGNTKSETHRASDGRKKAPKIEDRMVIAWDMEGISMSGQTKPQHAVLFGCSADPENPLIAKNLNSGTMLKYIIETGQKHPYAIHVGYGFRYDANMILKDAPDQVLIKLHKFNEARFMLRGKDWYVKWIPGKMLTITEYHGPRTKNHRNQTTVTIYDYSAYFGVTTFIKACESILQGELTTNDRQIIEHGKAERKNFTWKDLKEIVYYWKAEIRLIQRTFSKFRDVMCQAGFPLPQWYGPGALANYILASRKLYPHIAGAQQPHKALPDEAHFAIKSAFGGGRFQLFQAGRMGKPVHLFDLGGAYPHALSLVPSLALDTGEWKHVESPKTIRRFGFYRISYKAPGASAFETRPMPLFWRDSHGLITFPNVVTGWYPSPEAILMLNRPGATIHEGWEWVSAENDFPWQFLQEMYDTRMRLGKKNLLSMAFKLGPNSLYGKLAQTVGWNKKKKLPPKAHSLAIAAWITSHCRARVFALAKQAPLELVAIETDSVMTTANPDDLNLKLGPGLGEWGHEVLDDCMYIQSGMYHKKVGDNWVGKTRGLLKREFAANKVEEWLQTLIPGENWHNNPLILPARRFIGIGAAIASSEQIKDIHCSWRDQNREVRFGEVGKTQHISKICPTCQKGLTPWEAPHQLYTVSKSDGITPSYPRTLPWELDYPEEVKKLRAYDIISNDLIQI
jgi:hypothetical protein